MPDFYVHLRTPAGLEPSDACMAFADLEAVYLDVCRTIPGLVPDLLRAGHSPARCAFEITDADGALLVDVPFAEVLDPIRIGPRRALSAISERCARNVQRTQGLAAEITATEHALKDNLRTLRTLLAQAERASRGSMPDEAASRSGSML